MHVTLVSHGSVVGWRLKKLLGRWRNRGTPSAPSSAYPGQQNGIGLAIPASLSAPCADKTDCHAADDAHEVMACQAARMRIR
jgi:hypothetical protein